MSLKSRIRKLVRNDFCVYWPPRGSSDAGLKYGEPEEISCRWVDGEEEMVGMAQRTYAVKATVTVEVDLAVGGLLWHDRLENWKYSFRAPSEAEGGFEIKEFKKLPDRKNRDFYRKALLGSPKRG